MKDSGVAVAPAFFLEQRGAVARRRRVTGVRARGRSRLVEHEIYGLQEDGHRRLGLVGRPLSELRDRNPQNARELLLSSGRLGRFLQSPAVHAGGHFFSSPLAKKHPGCSTMAQRRTIAARTTAGPIL